MTKTFRHAGKFGDLIYALPIIRYFGGGVILLECEAPYIDEPLKWERWQSVVPLLSSQPYVHGVERWNGQNVDVNLNNFRAVMFPELRKNLQRARNVSLHQWCSMTFEVPESEWQTPWLKVPENDAVPYASPVVINRSPRYHNPRFPWDKVFEKYSGEWKQIGHLSEIFANSGTFRKTADLLEAAQVINDAQLFIGNQSCCYAIAEGLKKPCVVEIYPEMPNTLFHREHCWHGFNENVFLPDLGDLP